MAITLGRCLSARAFVLRTGPISVVPALRASIAIAALCLVGCGDASARVAPKHHYKWPDAPCGGKKPGCDDYDYFIRNAVKNLPYKEKEVSPGHWQYVVDQDQLKFEAEEQKRRDDLKWALATRVLTDKEMDEVRGYGELLVVRTNQSYREEDAQKQLNDLLFQQFRLRAAQGMKTRRAETGNTDSVAKP